MKTVLVLTALLLLAGCTASRDAGPRVVRSFAGEDEVRAMIAATVARDPHFGGWSIIGAPKFADARLSAVGSGGTVLGEAGESYCVSATMIVAGIPQPKSAYVTVYRSGAVATARVRAGYCTGREPFPELERTGIGR